MHEWVLIDGGQLTNMGEWGRCNPIPLSSLGWADDADQLACRISGGGEGRVDARGECRRIDIVTGADDDSCVRAVVFLMKADEVEAVQGKNHAVQFRGVSQNLIVGNLLVCPAAS